MVTRPSVKSINGYTFVVNLTEQKRSEHHNLFNYFGQQCALMFEIFRNKYKNLPIVHLETKNTRIFERAPGKL
jgi:hypothetical protein